MHISLRPTTSTATRHVRRIPIILAFGLLAACASTPPSSEGIAVATAAVAQADTVATREGAGPELRLATNKLQAARDAAGRGDHYRALQLAEQAEADAHVAVVRAQSARARLAATESQESARVLREEIRRSQQR